MDTALPQPVFRQSVRLLRKWREYPCALRGDVWSFEFEPLSERFSPGQYVHFKLEDPGLEKSVRHISFASAPDDPALLFSFHLRPQSEYKQALARLQPGDSVTLFKYKGGFTLPRPGTPEAALPLVLIAGGIGITPFRSMLRHQQQHWNPCSVELLHVDREHYLFAEELAALPLPQQRIGSSQLTAALAELAARQPQALYYIAGATGFVNAVRDQPLAFGISDEQIRLDDFEGYAEL